jgi:hypothetical protein
LLLNNPSFESASGSYFNGSYSINGWNGVNPRFQSHTISTGAPGAGSKSWLLKNGGSLTTKTADRATVTGGLSYLLDFQVSKTKADPDLRIGLVASLTFYDASGTVLKVFSSPPIQSTGTSDWRRVRVLGFAPLDAVAASVRVTFPSGSYPNEDGRFFAVDDFSLTEFIETDTVGFRQAPMYISAGATSLLDVKIRVDANKDLLVRLNNGADNVVELRTAVGNRRRDVVSVSVPVPLAATASCTPIWTAGTCCGRLLTIRVDDNTIGN